jgi:hypothetical protein
VLAAVVLVALVLVAGLTPRAGLRGALLLTLVAVAWLGVNHPMEGPTLLVVTHNHGLTGGDLAGFAGIGLAAVRAAQAVRARRSRAG